MNKRTMFLSPRSVDRLIKNLNEDYREKRVKEIALDLLSKIAPKAVKIVKTSIVRLLAEERQSNSWTGELANSVRGIVDTSKGVAYIRVDSEYGAYVEFGTGVVGAENPYRLGDISQHGWNYDVNDHGTDGWVYYDEVEDEFRWTKGQPAGQFMIRSSLEINQFMEELYKTYKYKGGNSND